MVMAFSFFLSVYILVLCQVSYQNDSEILQKRAGCIRGGAAFGPGSRLVRFYGLRLLGIINFCIQFVFNSDFGNNKLILFLR